MEQFIRKMAKTNTIFGTFITVLFSRMQMLSYHLYYRDHHCRDYGQF